MRERERESASERETSARARETGRERERECVRERECMRERASERERERERERPLQACARVVFSIPPVAQRQIQGKRQAHTILENALHDGKADNEKILT